MVQCETTQIEWYLGVAPDIHSMKGLTTRESNLLDGQSFSPPGRGLQDREKCGQQGNSTKEKEKT